MENTIIFDDIESVKDDLVTEFENLRDECQDALEAMPEHLQDTSSSGELLNERIEALEQAIDEIENIEIPEVEEDDSVSEFIDLINNAWPEL